MPPKRKPPLLSPERQTWESELAAISEKLSQVEKARKASPTDGLEPHIKLVLTVALALILLGVVVGVMRFYLTPNVRTILKKRVRLFSISERFTRTADRVFTPKSVTEFTTGSWSRCMGATPSTQR